MKPLFFRLAFILANLLFVAAFLGAGFFYWEAKTGYWQSRYFSNKAKNFHYKIGYGKSDQIAFPAYGPHNERRGYTLIPSMTQSLEKHGYTISRQAILSPEMMDLAKDSLPLIFQEQNQAGMIILDRNRDTLYKSMYPTHVYSHFDSIPKPIATTLMYIEDRNLLDSSQLRKNPAIDWERTLFSVAQLVMSKIGPRKNIPGASTLATQVEKFRYWPGGRTLNIYDKLYQMKAASLRAYQGGPNTLAARKQILLNHLNGSPFSAYPRYGEVNGIGEALAVWYGANIDSVNYYLRNPKKSYKKAGKYYRMVLSLVIAHRRPSYYLLSPTSDLDAVTNVHLKLFRKKKIINDTLCVAAMIDTLANIKESPIFVKYEISKRKSVNSIRTPLLNKYGISQLYQLDRIHNTVTTTLDAKLTIQIIEFLRSLRNERVVDSLGLREARMLDKGSADKVVYSIVLFEKVGNRNLLRVQADSKDTPLNISEGIKLDLGSTAKLRTLITYLEIVETLYLRYTGMNASKLYGVNIAPEDHINEWVRSGVVNHQFSSISDALEQALQRTYSASPHERFFTGGGLHTFANFDDRYDGSTMTIHEAMRHSVNLVFVRLMRDIVRYQANLYKAQQLLSEDTGSSSSAVLLDRFIEHESGILLAQYFRQLRNIEPENIVDSLAAHTKPTVSRIASLYTNIDPAPTVEGLKAILAKYGLKDTSTRFAESVYKKYTSTTFTLSDKAFLANIHPLKLWAASYMATNPNVTFTQLKASSKPFLEDSYKWLRKTSREGARNTRIRQMLEMEAFTFIHSDWKKLGYPFNELVPSYATALGSSADRPIALAELAGIIQNDGMRYPSVRVESIEFAENTPYNTLVNYTSADTGTRVISKEVAQAARGCIYDVVDNGTAIRIKSAFAYGDTILRVGGKTGTGDHRSKQIARDGSIISERVMNRTATFLFILGDRFFGAISAFVPGDDAKNYGFTSTYPVQILKLMAPYFKDLVLAPPPRTKGISNYKPYLKRPEMLPFPVDTTSDTSSTGFKFEMTM